MLKFRLYFNKDKAAAWVNRMSQEGWAVQSFGAGLWKFARCAPGEYQYAIDFASGISGPGADYTDFMTGVGVTPVGRWGPWVLLRRPTAPGPFELYTDDATKAAQQRKILTFFKVTCLVELLCFAGLCLAAASPDGEWWMLFVAGFAGVVTLIFAARCFELRDSIAQLENSGTAGGAALQSRKRGLLCLAIGLVCTLSGLLLRGAAVPEGISGFLMGFGIVTELFAAVLLIRSRP